MMHGFGQYEAPDGSIIKGVWLHDRLNGRAVKDAREVIYKDDGGFYVRPAVTPCQKCYFRCNWFLCFLIVGVIALLFVLPHLWFITLFVCCFISCC